MVLSWKPSTYQQYWAQTLTTYALNTDPARNQARLVINNITLADIRKYESPARSFLQDLKDLGFMEYEQQACQNGLRLRNYIICSILSKKDLLESVWDITAHGRREKKANCTTPTCRNNMAYVEIILQEQVDLGKDDLVRYVKWSDMMAVGKDKEDGPGTADANEQDAAYTVYSFHLGEKYFGLPKNVTQLYFNAAGTQGKRHRIVKKINSVSNVCKAKEFGTHECLWDRNY